MKRHPIRCLLLFLALAVLSGCAGGTKVVIRQENYNPSFRTDAGRLKGKTVILDNFTNQAANTKQYGYYSADKNIYYEATTHLELHLWNCFQKAFQHAGIKVYDQSYSYDGYHPYAHHPYWWGGVPPPARPQTALKNAIEFQLVLLSLTDQECKFRVFLYNKGETKFQKDFSVTVPAPPGTDPPALEKNSYALIDQMVAAVFRDKDFRKAF